MAPRKKTSNPLDSIGIRKVQSIVGSLLYYARAIDSTILPALNDIGAQQSKATKDTLQRCNMLLDYVATYQNVKIRFHACDMQLNVDSDAAYLVQPQARSRYAGYFYLGSPQPKHYILNGAVLVTCTTRRGEIYMSQR